MFQIFLGFTLHKNHITAPQAGYTGNCCPIVSWLNVDPLCASAAPNHCDIFPGRRHVSVLLWLQHERRGVRESGKPAQDFFGWSIVEEAFELEILIHPLLTTVLQPVARSKPCHLKDASGTQPQNTLRFCNVAGLPWSLVLGSETSGISARSLRMS